MECLLFCCLWTLFLLFWCLLCWFLLFVCHYDLRKSIGFPQLFEQVLEEFTFNKWNLLFNFGQEIEFFRVLVGFGNILADDLLNLFVGEFDSNTTIFLKLLQIYSALSLFIFQVLNCIIELTWVGYTPISNKLSQFLPVIGNSFRELSSNWVKHITNFFLCLF